MGFSPRLADHTGRRIACCVLLAVLALVAGAACRDRESAAAAMNGGVAMDQTAAAPEFPKGFAWLNTDRPLRLAGELKGRVVVLDFWTYCCINCMHVLPDLDALERKFAGQPVVVIGVHSAKFANESSAANVRSAIQRYEIDHPVIVDENMRIWNAYGVNSWPTVVVIGPDGRIVGAVSGEGHREMLEQVIEKLLKEGREKGTLAAAPLVLPKEGMVRSASGLAFPGRVLADAAGGRLFVVDSNHNRIVVTSWPDEAGRCAATAIIGSGREGSADGGFAQAEFHRPQGVALAGEALYVADTENHLIRRVDLKNKTVSTVLGTGRQVWDPEGGKTGVRQGLNSPWDVAVDGTKLYIAMAGNHQLWVMNTLTGMAEPLAGSGRENIRDGVAAEANLAQPSGLALDAGGAGGPRLYFADSEVSAVRYVDLKARQVATVIGHGLFEFGDVDGVADTARFQHPLGVAVWNGKILVADTYNHKIRLVDAAKGTAETFAGTGKPGSGVPGGMLGLYEPGGISVAGGEGFIADTGNHRIVRVNLGSGAWQELMIDGLTAPADAGGASGVPAISAGAVELRGQAVTLALSPRLPAGAHLTPGSPVSVLIVAGARTIAQETLTDAASLPIRLKVAADRLPAAGSATSAEAWTIRVAYVYCSEGASAVCVPAQVTWELSVTVGAGKTEITLKE